MGRLRGKSAHMRAALVVFCEAQRGGVYPSASEMLVFKPSKGERMPIGDSRGGTLPWMHRFSHAVRVFPGRFFVFLPG